MSNETTSVVLSVCGIAAVVGVLIVLAAFLLLRVLKLSVFGLAINALRILTEPKEEPTALDIRAQNAAERLPLTRDLRSQAKSLDFDAAVARQRQTSSPPVQPSAYSAQSAAPGQPIQPPPQATTTYPAQPVPPPIQPIQPNTTYTPPVAPPGQPGFPTQSAPLAPGFNAPLRRPRKRRTLSEGDEPEEGLLGGMLDGDDVL